MIKAYTASPFEIKSIDSQKSRVGSGVSRYAEGMYFGDATTANYYLNNYKDYTDAHTKYEYKGTEILPGAKILPAIKALDRAGFDLDKAIASLDGDPESQNHLRLLDEQSELSLQKEITFSRGVVYDVSLRDVDINDLRKWDDTPGKEVILELAFSMAERLRKRGVFNQLDFDNLEISNDYDAESIIDTIYENIQHEAYENGMDNTDREELKEVFLFRLFGDYNISSNWHDDAAELEETEAFRNLEKLNLSAFFPINSEMTYGDLYAVLTSSVSDLDKMDYELIESRRMASEIMSKELNIPGFLCEAMRGFDDSMEIVIIDESLLKNSKFNELDSAEFESIVSLETGPLYPKNTEFGEDFDPYDYDNRHSMGY